ncbi:leucine-rich repeat containing protein [Thecamonas trahens ATCC 50062]|uniref:Leucine-rich repeat containing protein n=1 Tax=Thecamonas trahens ATCC 50062 TaxID=461836 RepID=A0A0L0DTQ6_THETB|nr:leucine-rich repeat containing protein [Thecamonas trahens ATCC 50062]KNC55436.1 leucine-rich repeat containing protein [Thecamonas trahens ATCC 50062]|eukprot:XP_013752973.1 leucine-rich repeat containing protein [Thecamonas trahens ATCC 50062]
MDVSLQGLSLRRLRIPSDVLPLPPSVDPFSPLQTRSSRKRKRSAEESAALGSPKCSARASAVGASSARRLMGDITSLDVSYNSLTNLPSQLVNLSALAALDASNNRIGLRGTSLPDALSGLRNLTRLDLSWNRLTKLAPVLGALPALTYLNLADNRLQEVSDSLGGLASTLRTLNIDGNEEIGKFPPVISKLTSLTELYMDATSLSKIPGTLSRLTKLHSLTLADNKLGPGSCAASLSNLVSLHNLVLDSNSLRAVPSFVSALPQLAWLSLRSNPIASLAPLVRVTSLAELDVQDTHIETLPARFASLPSLTYIGADSTELCELPPALDAAMTSGRLAIGLPYHMRPTDPPAAVSPMTSRAFRLRHRHNARAPKSPPKPRAPSPPIDRTISFAEPASIASVCYFDRSETPSMIGRSSCPRVRITEPAPPALNLSADNGSGADDGQPAAAGVEDHDASSSSAASLSLDSPTRFKP